MQYRFTADQDWSDFSTGRFLRSGPGQTAFPARLANELFMLCAAVCEHKGNFGPYIVYDPCCGSGTLLTEIAFLNPERICQLIGSDVDLQALETARNNLGLLTIEGATNRLLQIEADYQAYGKQSHKEALKSAHHLRDQIILNREQTSITTKVLHLDATQLNTQDVNIIGSPDIVLTDIPYGIKSNWKISPDALELPIQLLLQSLLILPGKPIVAIVADKKTRIEHKQYQRWKRLLVGKRQMAILSMI